MADRPRERADIRTELADKVEENKRQQADIEMFARAVNVLTVESDQLSGQHRRNRAAPVTLRPAPEPGLNIALA
ncbi:hypothetical protein ACFV30_39020 [Streptomyces sp. NPDC059752]|uniref:hypothetical protein n=1 Tax=unclassified Streptomyces TaxID=2593676 RepID=UPI003655CEA6